jgi:RNA polymerase sigma-70 factor (ECF subfamily)
MTETPDRLDVLLAAASAGDDLAYRRFLEEAAVRLRSFAARRLGGDAELEDVVQECLIAIHEKRGTLDPRRPVGPWLYAIARYKIADSWRRRRRRPVPAALPEIAVEAETGAARDTAMLLDRLPEAQAEAIRLTKLEGMTTSEAGARVGIGTSALKLRVHRGMARLKHMVGEKDG